MIIIKIDTDKYNMSEAYNIFNHIKNGLPSDENVVMVPLDIEVIANASKMQLLETKDMIDRALELKEEKNNDN